MTRYRLTLLDRLNPAELPKVHYLDGLTRQLALQLARKIVSERQMIVDLVPLD